MNKKSMVVEKSDKRDEVKDKANFVNSDTKEKEEVEVDLVDTVALNDVLNEINVREASVEEKRSEIDGKFEIKKENTEVLSDAVNSNENEIEELEDKVQESVENISIAMIVAIILICFVVGTIIGYMLYRIAMGW